jgi:hypothetical protein
VIIVQISGENLNESKFYSGRNREWPEISGCLLSFGAEAFVLQFAIQKYEDIQNYNSETTVLRRIFGSKRDEVTGGCRELHNVALNDQYCSPNIVRVIKSRRMR